MIVETERLCLRPFGQEDVDAYAAMCADPEVMRYLSPTGEVLSREDAWRQMAMFAGHWQFRGFGMWAAEERATGRFVGRVGLHYPEGWPDRELGWALCRQSWGRGLATEAARAAADHAFRTLGWTHLVSLILPGNARSIRVAERLGAAAAGVAVVRGVHHLVYRLDSWAQHATELPVPGTPSAISRRNAPDDRANPSVAATRGERAVMEPMLTEVVAILSRSPAALSAMLDGLPESLLTWRAGEETFSARDVLGHLIHGEETDWVPRIRLILSSGDAQPFVPFDRSGFRDAIRGRSAKQLLGEFESLRRSNLSFLNGLSLTSAQLSLPGRHPELGLVTLGQLLATWAVHDLNHIGQVARLLSGRHAEAVGPWKAYLGILNR